MRRRRFPVVWLCLLLLLTAGIVLWWKQPETSVTQGDSPGLDNILDTAKGILSGEPTEVKELRKQEIVQSDETHQEYYFSLLSESEQKIYREMQEGIAERQDEFYLTTSDENLISRVYHAFLNDHPEMFWVHNRQKVYTTAYPNSEYCRFSPGYMYTEEEVTEITDSMEQGFQEMYAQIPADADTYEKVKTVYTYVIDLADYESSEDDQSIAGIFWRKKAVCAGYARAVQYLLERLGIPCIYAEGSARESGEGHAWNIVEIDGQYYYVDATNGDQPSFLEGDAVQLAEHKTIIYDYLCPFPQEYEQSYQKSDDFTLPACTASDRNFYVLNQACFDSYDEQTLYDFCCMRLDNGAAVIRFKFSSQDAFESAYRQWIQDEYITNVARYYLSIYGMDTVEYHYGILENFKTLYFMF